MPSPPTRMSRATVVTGQDAEKASVQYIIDGKQSMTVFKDVRTLVKDAITAAVAFLKGKTPAATTTYNNGKIDVPAKPSAVVTVDKDNVKAALIDSGYYQASDFTGLDAAAAAARRWQAGRSASCCRPRMSRAGSRTKPASRMRSPSRRLSGRDPLQPGRFGQGKGQRRSR